MNHRDTPPVEASGGIVDEPRIWFEKAEKCADAGRNDLAMKYLRTGLSYHPEDPDLHGFLGWLHVIQRELELANLEVDAALRIDPTHRIGNIVLAAVASLEGRIDDAERVFISLLSRNPIDEFVLVRYSAMMHDAGRIEIARDLSQRALRINPENQLAISILSSSATTQRDPDLAESLAEASLRLDPHDWFSHVVMGRAALSSGRPFIARTHLRQALRLNPQDEVVRNLFLAADRCCRPTMLPNYALSVIRNQVPAIYAVFSIAFGLFLMAMWLGGDGALALLLLKVAIFAFFFVKLLAILTPMWIWLFPVRFDR